MVLRRNSLSLPFKHETKFVQYAAKEMGRFERKCKQLLVDSRPEAGGDETTIESQSPKQLLSLFGRITIFLLCAVSQHAVNANTINLLCGKVGESLREPKGILLHLAEHTELTKSRTNRHARQTRFLC
jgi:hypothetical protein